MTSRKFTGYIMFGIPVALLVAGAIVSWGLKEFIFTALVSGTIAVLLIGGIRRIASE
jgi:hypothetical protein